MSKKYKLNTDEIKLLIDLPGYCLATDQITVNGNLVGFMYREEPDGPQDSGWRFFSGTESDEEANDPSKVGMFSLNTIANYDGSIIPLLSAGFGRAFARNDHGTLVEEAFSPSE
jgi:hypothetical protein